MAPLLLVRRDALDVVALYSLIGLRMISAPTRRFLTDEGIEFLREYLNLPSEIVPATLKKSTRPLERNTGCVSKLSIRGYFMDWWFAFKECT